MTARSAPSGNRAAGTFGSRLRETRQLVGLTLRQLGEAVGVSPSFLCDCESDLRRPSGDVLESIVDAIGGTSGLADFCLTKDDHRALEDDIELVAFVKRVMRGRHPCPHPARKKHGGHEWYVDLRNGGMDCRACGAISLSRLGGSK